VRVPSAYWLTGERQADPRGEALLVGDAVHNLADPRLQAERKAGFAVPLSFWIWPWPVPSAPASDTGLNLPTLPGSRLEVNAAAQVLRKSGRPATTLVGTAANIAALERGFARTPSVVHFATHVVDRPSAGISRKRLGSPGAAGIAWSAVPWKDDAMLALSLGADGARDTLDAASVPGFEMRGGLVVLSACSSGVARPAAGGGLAGFTRAWLAAGASSVMATLWPAQDDTADFFRAFYSALARSSRPQAALRSAQIEMIRGSAWRARPSHWATYFVVNKE
jgi:CHAT domain-containing protein